MAKAPVFRPELLKCGLFSGVDGSLLPILAQTLKAQGAVHLGEQGIVSADAHVGAGMDLGAALTHQDVAGSTCQALLTGMMVYFAQLHDEYPEHIEVLEDE